MATAAVKTAKVKAKVAELNRPDQSDGHVPDAIHFIYCIAPCTWACASKFPA